MSEHETFFYNPKRSYFSDGQNYLYEAWSNGVLCNDYKGNEWVLTEMECSVKAEEVQMMNGQIHHVEKYLTYSLTIKEIGVLQSGTISTTLNFPRGNGGMFEEWLKDVIL